MNSKKECFLTFLSFYWFAAEQNCSQTIIDKLLIVKDGYKMMQAHSEINVSRQDKYSYSLWNRYADNRA